MTERIELPPLLNIEIALSNRAVIAYMAFLPFGILWFWGVHGKLKQMLGKRTLAGLKGLLIGCAAAFLLNDSGIVMANIMLAMTAVVLLYSLLEDRKPCPGS